MKHSFTKVLAIFTVLALLITTFSAPLQTVKASENFEVNDFEVNDSSHSVNVEPPVILLDDEGQAGFINEYGEYQPYVIPAVVWFLGGIIANITIDGFLIYKTGRSSAEWAAYGLSNMEAKVKDYWRRYQARNIYTFRTGDISECVTFPCPIGTEIEAD